MAKKFAYYYLITFFLICLSFLNIRTNPVFADDIAGKSAWLSPIIYEKENTALKSSLIKKAVIKKVLEKYNSPLSKNVDSFVNACQKYEIDCYLLPSIAGLESTFGKFILPDSNNPFGWGRGFIRFEDWHEGIMTVGKGLRQNYIDKGAVTLAQIGRIYSESATWTERVQYFINDFQKEEEKYHLFSVN